jgi:hypothetical protein
VVGGNAPLYQWGNFSEANPCDETAWLGASPTTTESSGSSWTGALPSLGAAASAPPLQVQGGQCVAGASSSLRSARRAPPGEAPGTLVAEGLSLTALNGLAVVLWFQYACVLTEGNITGLGAYGACGPMPVDSSKVSAWPSLTLSWTPDSQYERGTAFRVSLAPAAGGALAFKEDVFSNLTITVAWSNCKATASVSSAFLLVANQFDHSMLAVLLGAHGGLSLFLNNQFLVLQTNRAPACYAGTVFFNKPSTGRLVVARTQGAWTSGGAAFVGDLYGFDDLQVLQGSVAPGQLVSAFDSVYAALLPPPPPAGRKLPGVVSCTISGLGLPAHRYAGVAKGFTMPGLLLDTGSSAQSWDAQRMESAVPASPADTNATGTLTFSFSPPAAQEPAATEDVTAALRAGLPAPAPDISAEEWAALTAGYTVRLLYTCATSAPCAPALQWMGLSVSVVGGSSLRVQNSYTGPGSSFRGPGTPQMPTLPWVSGQYTTFVFSTTGTTVYAGPYLWVSLPAVQVMLPSWVLVNGQPVFEYQGKGWSSNQLALPADSALLDMQVYDQAFSGQQVISAAAGLC